MCEGSMRSGMMLSGDGTWTGTSLMLHLWAYSSAADLMSSLPAEQSLYQDWDPAWTWTQVRMASVPVQLIIICCDSVVRSGWLV